jgi:hypothetical protein
MKFLGLIIHVAISSAISFHIIDGTYEFWKAFVVFIAVYLIVCSIGVLIKKKLAWWPDPIWGLARFIDTLGFFS